MYILNNWFVIVYLISCLLQVGKLHYRHNNGTLSKRLNKLNKKIKDDGVDYELTYEGAIITSLILSFVPVLNTLGLFAIVVKFIGNEIKSK